jgi:hypothetical protein
LVHKLFESFLDDPNQYRACEQYWEELTSKIADSVGQGGEWQPWITRQSPNGTPVELDGNPISDGKSEKLDRAFRIIQHRPQGDELEISAWLKHYEAEYADLPRDELVINLSLSEESADLVRALLKKWIVPETTSDEMAKLIQISLPVSDQ